MKALHQCAGRAIAVFDENTRTEEKRKENKVVVWKADQVGVLSEKRVRVVCAPKTSGSLCLHNPADPAQGKGR